MQSKLVTTSSTSLAAMKKGKFNKQKDLAAKMEEAKRLREAQQLDPSSPKDDPLPETPTSEAKPTDKQLSSEEIKQRNDRQRFADLLENSMNGVDGGDGGVGGDYYLTVEQEEENADAVYRGIHRLYEGDPAPSSPFAELLNIETGEPLGHSGMSRLVPWEGGSKTAPPNDYLVVITDPRPKSIELRSAVKRLCNGGSGLGVEVLKRTVVINSDTPGENRKFLKKNFAENSVGVEALTVLVDENLEWMREYTALGEK
eukprot:scaffold5676_cov189-Alexandrium_tamarense.AAC.8